MQIIFYHMLFITRFKVFAIFFIMNTIITPTVDLEKEVLMQIKQHSPRE